MLRSRSLPLLLGLVAAVLAALLVPAAPAGAAPVVALAPSSGASGSTTTVTGTGFPARTRGTVTAGGTVVEVRTDRLGALTAPVAVRGPAGPLPVVVAVGRASASSVFTVLAAQEVPALRFGASTPGGLRAAAELDAVAASVGEQPGVVLSYTDFTRDVDVAGLEAVAARGAVPLLTWEPWAWGGGVDQPAYRLAAIARGDHDAHLRRVGQQLAAYGQPVWLRFAHEMNGAWYPWSEAVGGQAAGDYVRAWRRVHEVVTAAGATNAEWVWSPNVPYPGSLPLSGLFPGADVVDRVALDGYNWGTSQGWSTWTGPEALFGEGLAQLRSLAPGLPVLVAEVASAEEGGDKAAWNRALVAYLDAQPDVTALVWFDHLKEADWRIGSSSASAQALREALAARTRTPVAATA